MKNDGKSTLYELLVGVVFLSAVCLFGNLIISNKLAYSLGLLLGCMISVLMCVHMYFTLQKAMLYDPKAATAKTRFAAAIRMLFMCAGLVVSVIFSKWFSVTGTLLGILSLKFSAYLQPLTHKVINKFKSKGR